MRFLFFILLFTFDYLFISGFPIYLLVFPFVKNVKINLLNTFKNDRDIRKIIKSVFIYSILLLGIHFIHGDIKTGFTQFFALNLLTLLIGVELFSFSREDYKLNGHKYLFIIFVLNEQSSFRNQIQNVQNMKSALQRPTHGLQTRKLLRVKLF